METVTFNTVLGEFGIGWTDRGVARLQLPGLEHEALGERLNRNGAQAGEPSRMIAALIDKIEDYAEGSVVEFRGIPLDLAGVPEFHQRAYGLLLGFGWGQTTTYGELARALGDVTLARAVGQAMGSNPIPLIIPCHRVLASGRKAGGFSAPGGAVAKVHMLALEGVAVGAPAGQLAFGF